jgi:hypothetical protein
MLREGQNGLRARLQQLKSNERNGGYGETVMFYQGFVAGV